jgi:hypothetical protein
LCFAENACQRRKKVRFDNFDCSTENGQDLEPPIVPVLRTTNVQQPAPTQSNHHFIKNEQLQQQQQQQGQKKEESVIGAAIERKTPLTRDDIQGQMIKNFFFFVI